MLVNPGGDLTNYWEGPYITQIPLDGWGHAFLYQSTARWDYNIISAGPDGQLHTADDIDINNDK